MQADRIPEAETTLLGIISAYPNSPGLANMLPHLLAASVPKILKTGSGHFTFADGSPLSFGRSFSPPEYTMVYLELLMHKPLLGRDVLGQDSILYNTLKIMWELLMELIPASQQRAAIERMESYTNPVSNILPFRKKH